MSERAASRRIVGRLELPAGGLVWLLECQHEILEPANFDPAPERRGKLAACAACAARSRERAAAAADWRVLARRNTWRWP